MPYAIVEDIAASWERYAAVAAAIADPTVPGLILYAAGATDEGVRVIAVCEDAEAWESFRRERLAPAVALLQEAPVPPPAVRELEAAHLVVAPVGATIAIRSSRGGQTQGRSTR